MNLIKKMGMGAFYRARRISKVVRNWRKFGVIVFGSLFLASTLGANLAAADTMVQVTISPTSSEINLGSSKQFSAQVHTGIVNVTGASNVSWTVSKGAQNVATGSGSVLNFTPSTSGTYIIRAAANYQGTQATLREPATLLVKDAGDNTPLTVSIAPTSSTIAVGQSQTYTPNVMYGATTVTGQSTINWVVSKNNATVKTGLGQSFSYTPTASGTYTVVAHAIYMANNVQKNATSNTAILNVTGGSGGGTTDDLQVTISPTSAEITLGESKTFTAQVHNGVVNVTSGSNITWTASQNNAVVATGSGVTLTLTPSTTGTFVIRAAATYQGKPAVLREPATLLVKNGITPPPPTSCSIMITNSGTGNIQLGQPSPIYTATVTQNGVDVTNQSNIEWTVKRSGDAQIHFTGSGKTFSFTPAIAGTYSIQARTMCGSTAAIATVILTVNPGQPTNCTVFKIEPGSVTLPFVNGSASQVFTLKAEDASGNSVTPTNVVWSVKSGPGTIVPIGNGSSQATFTTTTPNQTSVVQATGLCNGTQATATASVSTVTGSGRILMSVQITPIMPTILSGTNQTYKATAFDQFGQEINPANEPISFTWDLDAVGDTLGILLSNTGEQVVFKSNSGLTNSYFGFIEVTAHYKGIDAFDDEGATFYELSIQQTLNYVTMTPDRNPININDSTLVRAQAYDNNNVAIPNCSYQWTQLSGAGSITSNTNQQVITFSSQSLVGTGNLQVTATCLNSTVSTTGSVTIVGSNQNLRVEITPDPAYAQPNTDIVFTARAYENNNQVTNSTNFNWNMLNSNAGDIISTNGNQATVRTDDQDGTFGSAIQVTGTRNGMTGTDTATIIIDDVTPNFDITSSMFGSLNDNGTANCADDVIVYTISLTNNQRNNLHDVRVSLNVPANTNFLSASSTTGSPSISGSTITWDAGTLGHGQTKSMTLRVTPRSGLSGSHVINASASVSANEISSRNISANAITLNCSATPTTPRPPRDGKGPLVSTGTPWQTMVAMIGGAFVLASIAYLFLKRREQNVYNPQF